jgi:CubicO group peptidase (beta-lactamase class C family)
VRHLLTNTAGLGWAPGLGPLTDEMDDRGVGPGTFGPDLGADEFLRRLGDLPLSAHPGDGWAYHTCSDVLSVLLARATGRTVGALVTDCVTGPLGLRDTSFWTTETDRLASCYLPTDAGLELCEPPDGRFARPRPFETLSAGLLSTAPDVLAVLTAVLAGGGRVLTPNSAVALTTDALGPAQRAAAAAVVGPGRSYGAQVGVDVEARDQPFRRRGRWGWDGGTGTSAWVDPGRQLAGVLLTQRMMTGEHDEPSAFWAALTACA